MLKPVSRYYWSAALIAIAGLLALLPAVVLGIPAGHDLPNHLRLAVPFYNAIHLGHLHPGWLAEANGGFGDASLRFYPPALYYWLFLTREITGSLYSGFLLGFVLLSILGSLGAFFWAKSFVRTSVAVWAAIFYAFIPYRINQFYGASLLAEYAAGTVLPFALAFVHRICRHNRWSDAVGLGISFALLILSNLPLAIIGSLALLGYGLLSIDKTTARSSLLRLSTGVLLGLAVSAFYWSTVISELRWIRNQVLTPDEAVTSYFDYRKNFAFSPFSLNNTNSWFANTLALSTLSMAFAPLIMLLWRRRPKLGRDLKVVFALFGFSFFMVTDLSRPLWFAIPKLKEVQFPWRWLAVCSAAVALLTAASIPFCREYFRGRLRPLAIIAMGGVLISITYSGARIRDANYLPRFEFGSASNTIFATNSIDYWLPVWIHKRPQPMAQPVETTDRVVQIEYWQAETRRFSIGPGPAEEIRIRTFYYPHWQAMSSGRTLNTRPAYDGSLLISIPPEAVDVALQFREPKRVWIALGVSAIGLLSSALLLFYDSRRKISSREQCI